MKKRTTGRSSVFVCLESRDPRPAGLGGHGVGKHFHMEPYVAHIGEPNTGMLMVPGMVFTVEPMISAGRPEVDVDEEDGWTVTTHDGALSAQWEKTILITDTGAEVLAW